MINEQIAEEIVSASTGNRRFLSLPEKFIIPEITPTTSSPGSAQMVEIYDGRIIQGHLLWFLLYQGISTLDWLILYYKLESMKISDSSKQSLKCLTLLLFFSSNTRKGLKDWESKTKPIHRKLKTIVPRKDSDLVGEYQSFLEYSMKILKIPNKGFDHDHLYRKSIISIPRVRFQEEQFVGVGYKDKGTLSEPRVEPPISVEALNAPPKANALSIEKCLNSLFESWQYK